MLYLFLTRLISSYVSEIHSSHSNMSDLILLLHRVVACVIYATSSKQDDDMLATHGLLF